MTTAAIVAGAQFGTVRPQRTSRWMCELRMHMYLMTIISVPVGSLEKKSCPYCSSNQAHDTTITPCSCNHLYDTHWLSKGHSMAPRA